MASRICAQAAGGEILIAEPLRHLLSGKSYVYADRGETMLKGFEDAVRLYEVRWTECLPTCCAPAAGSGRCMRVFGTASMPRADSGDRASAGAP
jgi:hypothetical protein